MSDISPPPDAFAATRDALHAVAEHVLAAASYRATGRIGLAVAPGGFTTPSFGDTPTAIALDGADLVVRSGADGQARVVRGPLTTLRDAAALAGISPGGPCQVYPLATLGDPDAPLAVDPDAARRIPAWYALGDAALRLWRHEIAADNPSDVTLWPEHLDVALRAADVNYGASPGDEHVAQPYLYVGPPLPPPATADGFWNAPFGAYLAWENVHSVADAVDFFRAGRHHALG